MTSAILIISAIIIAVLVALTLATPSEKVKEDAKDIAAKAPIQEVAKEIASSVLGNHSIIADALKEPEEDRSRFKHIIDVGNPLGAPGIGYEMARIDLPLVHEISVDALLMDQWKKVGIGIAKDIKGVNIDVGAGVVTDLNHLCENGQVDPEFRVYVGVHF
jgi:hypothetical protein